MFTPSNTLIPSAIFLFAINLGGCDFSVSPAEESPKESSVQDEVEAMEKESTPPAKDLTSGIHYSGEDTVRVDPPPPPPSGGGG